MVYYRNVKRAGERYLNMSINQTSITKADCLKAAKSLRAWEEDDFIDEDPMALLAWRVLGFPSGEEFKVNDVFNRLADLIDPDRAAVWDF